MIVARIVAAQTFDGKPALDNMGDPIGDLSNVVYLQDLDTAKIQIIHGRV